MQKGFAPIMRDFLIRFQQTAIRETGRRPVTYLRSPMDRDLILPGCQRPGYTFWQPMPWPKDGAPLGQYAASFHETIVEYLAMCQFLEIRFRLPVAQKGSPLSFLFHRVFETYRNTVSAPPARAFEEAAFLNREQPSRPLAFCMAATCDAGEPLLLMLDARDGQVFLDRAGQEPLYFKLGVDRLLPKLLFVYDM